MSKISGIRFSKWLDIRQNYYPVHPHLKEYNLHPCTETNTAAHQTGKAVVSRRKSQAAVIVIHRKERERQEGN